MTNPHPGTWYVTLPPEAAPYAGRSAGPFATEADAVAWLWALPFIRGAVVWERTTTEPPAADEEVPEPW